MPKERGGAKRLPETAITRLSIYRRALERLAAGHTYVSSARLSAITGFTAAQIRRDLAHFGQFGVPGTGYEVRALQMQLSRILGAGRSWRVALVGVGSLGSALLAYRAFQEQGFRVVAAFDNDLVKVGKRWEGIEIEHASRISGLCRELGVEIGVVTVPARAAQEAVSSLVAGGVKAILNFAPHRVEVPEGVRLRSVDLSVEMEALAFHLLHDPPVPRR